MKIKVIEKIYLYLLKNKWKTLEIKKLEIIDKIKGIFKIKGNNTE